MKEFLLENYNIYFHFLTYLEKTNNFHISPVGLFPEKIAATVFSLTIEFKEKALGLFPS